MVSIRTKTGKIKRLKKGDFLTTSCYYKHGKRFHQAMVRCKIFLLSNRRGRIVKDGREVKKIKKRWVILPIE